MFTDTTGALSRQARVLPATVRRYADLGLLEFVVAADGTRLFRTGQADLVRKILAERMANRGVKKGTAA
jgi:DNA-binding transcriptional MerR regulator